MTLRDVASVAGKPGLYKVVKPTRSGVILETIDDKKKKLVAGANNRVSILKEISIYTTGSESSVLLEDILGSIHTKYNDKLPVDGKSSESELKSFLQSVLENFDEERVYPSDIKKLVSWYNTLFVHASDLLQELAKAVSKDVEKEEKPKAKKTTKKKEA